MSSIDEVFRSRFLKAADLDADWELVIHRAAVEKIKNNEGGEDEKLVIEFQDLEKQLVCNKTNAELIAAQHGRDYSHWTGKSVILTVEDVPFGGKITPAIRVRRPARPTTPVRRSQAPAKPTVTQPVAHSEREAADAAADEAGVSGQEIDF